MSNDTTIWKDIPGWEGLYQVSNTGLVKRIGKKGGATVGKILSLTPNNAGYPIADLNHNGARKTTRIHRLVMLAFVGECPEGMQVNHKNGNKTDNRIENLEYVTPGENTRHAHLNGLVSSAKGERSSNAKLKESEVREIISLLRDGEITMSEIARRYNVRLQCIQGIKYGKNWRHLPR